jgi:hypothetical protein
MEGKMNAEEWIILMLEEANMLAQWYKTNMVNATTKQLNESLEDPAKYKVIMYLAELLQ